MIRDVYRMLLALLPSDFRREFGDEMLWIFDQDADGQIRFIVDVACSVMRQRLTCHAFWQSVVAVTTAPLPYVYALQVWKSLNNVSRTAVPEQIWLQTREVAAIATVLAVAITGVAYVRRVSHRGLLVTLREQ